MTQAVSKGTQVNVGRSVVRLSRNDITDIEVDAFVFYAQNDLALGSGFGTAISVRGGPTIQRELDELAPVETGDVVVSAAGNLKVEYIIHAVGPKFQEEKLEEKLRTTMRNTLNCAEEKGIKSLALPAMGAGYYGIAPDLCARVMLEVAKDHLGGETCIEELTICVLDTPQYNAFEKPVLALAQKKNTT